LVFAGLNILAIVLAALAGFAAGALWYTSLSAPWLAAVGLTKDDMASSVGKFRALAPFLVSMVSLFVMAWVLAGVLGHLGPGQVTVRNGIISALFLWTGFIATTIATNNAFAKRRLLLTLIDGGHWLVVMVVMGIVIGLFGA
jgi:hypothetical protein